MTVIFDTDQEVHFGEIGAELPNWRLLPDEPDPDDEVLEETPADVVAILGFDPLEFATNEDVVNHPGHPNQKVHGRKRGGKSRGGGGGGAVEERIGGVPQEVKDQLTPQERSRFNSAVKQRQRLNKKIKDGTATYEEKKQAEGARDEIAKLKKIARERAGGGATKKKKATKKKTTTKKKTAKKKGTKKKATKKKTTKKKTARKKRTRGGGVATDITQPIDKRLDASASLNKRMEKIDKLIKDKEAASGGKGYNEKRRQELYKAMDDNEKTYEKEMLAYKKKGGKGVFANTKRGKELVKQYDDMDDELIDLEDAGGWGGGSNHVDQALRSQVHKALKLSNAKRSTIEVAEGRGSGKKPTYRVEQKTHDAANFLADMTGKDQLDGRQPGGLFGSGGMPDTAPGKALVGVRQLGPRGRAYYSPSQNTVHLSPSDGTSIHVHEIGHHLEYSLPRGQTNANRFVEYRIRKAGTPNINLKQKFGGGFKRSETGNEDDFGKLWEGVPGHRTSAFYVGKRYAGGATEVLSMGTQLLHEDPVRFFKKDPEYFKFVVGTLSGEL